MKQTITQFNKRKNFISIETIPMFYIKNFLKQILLIF